MNKNLILIGPPLSASADEMSHAGSFHNENNVIISLVSHTTEFLLFFSIMAFPFLHRMPCFAISTLVAPLRFCRTSPVPILRERRRESRTYVTAVSDVVAKSGTLYLVATPIGHLQDMSLRARAILGSVDAIAAEDTRVTSHLLNLLSIKRSSEQTVFSCHAHNYRTRIPTILSMLSTGRSVALVSDAGTPCVSDPGAEIVAAAIASGVSVTPIPGPCAAVTALPASGLPSSTFMFLGFLPRTAQRTDVLDSIERNPETTIVLYEAPHRLVRTLSYLAERPDIEGRRTCLGRELTKKWEQFLRFDNLLLALEHFKTVEPRGEFTVILAPAPPRLRQPDSLQDYTDSPVNIPALVESLVRAGVPASSVARSVSSCTKAPKKLIYNFATNIKQQISKEQTTAPNSIS